MAQWVKAKVACRMLEKHPNQIAMDYFNDKKKGWNRRVCKGDDGFLYANVDDYRSPCVSNALTKKRIENLYYTLVDFMGEDNLIFSLAENFPHKTYASIKSYFNLFAFKDRKLALQCYCALRYIRQICRMKMSEKVSHGKLS